MYLEILPALSVTCLEDTFIIYNLSLLVNKNESASKNLYLGTTVVKPLRYTVMSSGSGELLSPSILE